MRWRCSELQMKSLLQILTLSAMGLRGLPHRRGACLVIVVGVAGAVAVLISVFAVMIGFTEMAARTGHPDRAIVMSGASQTESNSGLSRDDVRAILDSGAIATDSQGHPIASAEALALVRGTDRRTNLDAFATIRGVSNELTTLRPEIRLVEGRMFQPGLKELIVGRTLQRQLVGLEPGQVVELPQGAWTIVGVFASEGNFRESELLGDAEMLLAAYRRNVFNSVTVLLKGKPGLQALRDALATHPGLSLQVRTERDYLAAASGPTRRLLRAIAIFIGSVMLFGAVIAAINAMYSSMGSRSLEIATLRAIGFGATTVVVSVAAEALVLALLGAGIGAFAATQFLDGSSVSTRSSAGPSPVTFLLHVSPSLIATGIGSACMVGLLGGLVPATRIAKLAIASALHRT
jgi:putative ABC transport system permease protein